jgi:hypothetical protein
MIHHKIHSRTSKTGNYSHYTMLLPPLQVNVFHIKPKIRLWRIFGIQRIKSLMTSPAMMSPATDGTKDTEPGSARLPWGVSVADWAST